MPKKRLFIFLCAVTMLSACGSVAKLPQSTTPIVHDNQPYTLANHHWADVAKLRAEAARLGLQVQAQHLTKVQAAQHLNQLRLSLVGHNVVDDSVYDVYLQAAVDSQRGVIDSSQSRAYVENALRGWQQRWHNLNPKPTNPAFTNFLLEYYGYQPLR